eukprot:8659367-Karenia_brevis.AAC.1
MQHETGWEVGDGLTADEMRQIAQEFSCGVPNSHVPVPQAPLGKPFVEKGLVSDKATWADVAEDEQKKMEE